MTFENLRNNLTFTDPATRRGIAALRHIFDHQNGTIIIYLRDDAQSDIKPTFAAMTTAMDEEKNNDNVFRHFYTENLQTNNKPHKIDMGDALKPINQRPEMKTRSPSTYTDVFEMTTRIGVGIKQCAEFQLDLVQVSKIHTAFSFFLQRCVVITSHFNLQIIVLTY